VKHLRALLINPYIYDFSAYSFWSVPLGLLYMGSILRRNGIGIDLIDCLRVVEEKRKSDGRAPFVKEKVKNPDALKGVTKRLKRYGISKEALTEELRLLEAPDLVLITSIMTYWYPGAEEAAEAVREVFPRAKIVLGGIYPSLCQEHALKQMRQADLIMTNSESAIFYDFVESAFSTTLPFKPSPYDFESLPYPCLDLYAAIPFVPLLTSYGCAYKCTYCATPYMHPKMVRRSPQSTMDEIRFWHDRGVNRYVIYDDNFLYKSDLFAKPLLKDISGLPFSLDIYNPNAVNATFITEELAHLLAAAGFQEVRIGLETTDDALQTSTGGKVNLKIFERALRFLTRAGFSAEAIGVYILAGLPLQNWKDLNRSIDYLGDLGVRVHIAEYTPIPHTQMFEQFKSSARYPIAEDPIYQNNALFPFAWEGFTEDDLLFLKRYARERSPVSTGRPVDERRPDS
jgi:radical SAM superfamily enzyme YgiQ (UPF0313 family)